MEDKKPTTEEQMKAPQAHTDSLGKNENPVDSAGRMLETNDTVNIQAHIKSVSGNKVTLVLFTKEGQEVALGTVDGGLVTHSGINPRIAAAPELRTPVIEIPAKQGGIKPVPRDEYLETGDKNATAGLPTATREKSERIAPK